MSGHVNEGTQADFDEIAGMTDAQILAEFDREYPGGAAAAIADIQEEAGRHGQ